jgi:hypothetical protein
MASKYDVAIVGWWHNSNYGSIATYYALNKAIMDYGYSTVLVHESLGYPNRAALPADAPAIAFAQRQGFNFTDQRHFSENHKLNDIADKFVVGSDQIWNPYIPRINDDLFLNFTAPQKKRIAYGTSIGNFDREKYQSEHFGPDFQDVQKHNLERFDFIAMRECDGIDYFKKTFGFDFVRVVDPVFLIDAGQYHELASGTTKRIEGGYMLAFILDPSDDKRRCVKIIADKLGFERIAVFTDANRRQMARAKEIFNGPPFIFDDEIRPENWLHAYQNAQYVVTDSFHGSAFACIFQKPFSVFFNEIRGVNRFAGLMQLLGFDDSRRIHEKDTEEDIALNPNISMTIDFRGADKKLNEAREFSEKWLRTALSSKSHRSISHGISMANNKNFRGLISLKLIFTVVLFIAIVFFIFYSYIGT